MKKPDNIDAGVWKRFLAFEKFDRMKNQERSFSLFLIFLDNRNQAKPIRNATKTRYAQHRRTRPAKLDHRHPCLPSTVQKKFK